MGYCEIITLNPVDKVERVNDKLIMYSTYDMWCRLHYDHSFISSFIDDAEKYVVFTDTDKDLDLISMNKANELMGFELEEVRTKTDVSYSNQEIRFILVPLSFNGKQLVTMSQNDFDKQFNKNIIFYPKIVHYDGGEKQDYSLYFYVEGIQKTRKRKLEKIMKNKNVNNNS